MGLVASQSRLLMLYSHKIDVEFQLETITQQLMVLSASTMNIANAESQLMMQQMGTQMTEEQTANMNAAMAYIETRRKQANEVEKILTLQQKQLESREKMITTEIESVQKIIDKNIETSFKYMS